MCMRPCGPKHWYRVTNSYVEIKTIKAIPLKEAREHYTDADVIKEVELILENKANWSYSETRDRYVLEQLYFKDKYLARIGVTDKNRKIINEMVN